MQAGSSGVVENENAQIEAHRRRWLNVLWWMLIASNAPVGVYVGTVISNLLTYVGQSPDGFYALLDINAVANQLLILRFLPYWAKHRVMGALIVLQVPLSAIGGHWARSNLKRQKDEDIERFLEVRSLRIANAMREELEAKITRDVVLALLASITPEVTEIETATTEMTVTEIELRTDDTRKDEMQ